MKSSRRPPLRTPFISTFAAGAAAVILSGCGSAVVPSAACDGGACTDGPLPMTDRPVVVDDRPAGCPASAPTPGTACAVTTTCTYGSTTNPCGSFPNQFVCNPTNHQWIQSISTCNPPPVTCPPTLPNHGVSCTPGWGNNTCTYEAPACNGTPQRSSATCAPGTNTWSVTIPVCAPATCPTALPASGARCAYNDVTRDCRYPGRPCGSVRNDILAQCDPELSVWRVLEATCNPPPPMCPPTPPEGGTTCIPTPATMSCDYTPFPCDGSPQVGHASCDATGHWVVLSVSCNPPPPVDAGPPPPVDAGTDEDGGSPDDPGSPDV